MGTALRLVWKSYRFELASVIVAIGLLIAVSVVEASRLEAVKPTPACWAAYIAAEEREQGFSRVDCPSLEPWGALNLESGQLDGFFTYLPLIAGILLGSVLVSREVEHRTTQLAWSLGPSRRRWLLERVIPIGILLAVLLIGLAAAGNALRAGSSIGVDPRASLAEYGDRDIALVARGMAAFGIAVLVGALIGRQLPALIVSGALALMLLVGVNGAFPFGVEGRLLDPSEVPAGSTFEADATLLVRALYERKADGELFPVDEVYAMPPDPEGDAAGQWIRQRFTRVQLRLMGDQLDAIQVREAALLGGLLVLTLGATFVVIERREPS